MYGNSKHAYFSVRNPFPIPIKCSISMLAVLIANLDGWLITDGLPNS